MSSIPDALRHKVIGRARAFCEYCYAEMRIILFMHIDHIRPEVDNGKIVEENLTLTCPCCNSAKHIYQTGIDPDTGKEQPLFNPRLQEWHHHFQWEENYTVIAGLTPTGRATVHRLDMNRPGMVKARHEWRKAGWQPPD